MQWRSENDEKLAHTSGSADTVLEACALADMLGVWGANSVLRVKGLDGRAVWCWRATNGAGVLCCAVAPWGAVWDCDDVDGVEFFARNPSDGWVTKARLGVAKGDWTKPVVVWTRDTVWCVGLFKVDGKPRSRRVRLYKVGEVDGGQLVSVIPEDGAPSVPVALVGAARWIPQDKHVAGYAALWDAGNVEAKSYMWFVIYAKKAGKHA
jgi:hypothetical protein